jgi:hypothetical protein
MASTHILATGKIDRDGDVQWHIAPLQDFIDAALDADVPPTRDQRVDEAAHQADTEAYFRWAKREALDYEDYLADVDWLRGGC